MKRKKEYLKPHYWDIIALILIYVFAFIMIKPQSPAVFLLFLLSFNVYALRYRMNYTYDYIFMDVLIFGLIGSYYLPALYLLGPTIYVLVRFSKPMYVFFVLPIMIGFALLNWSLWLFLTFAFTSGLWIGLWQKEKHRMIETINDHRRKLYESEQDQTVLLESQADIARMAALSERDRIAQQLHDDLGHEITAGLLSLKAHQRLLKQGKNDDEMLQTAIQRIDQAASQLKDTVHNTKPLAAFGLEAFEAHMDKLSLPVDYKKQGDITRIPTHHWHVLNLTLKEALTNILKHAQATVVKIELRVTPQIVKLEVQNDGIKEERDIYSGLGLKYMRLRIENMDGSLSIQRLKVFKIIAVLPLKQEV